MTSDVEGQGEGGRVGLGGVSQFIMQSVSRVTYPKVRLRMKTYNRAPEVQAHRPKN